MAKKRMFIDMSKCIACRACQIACQQWHQLPAEDTSFTGSYQNPEDLSAANLTLTRFFEVGNNGDVRWLFFVDRCRHCKDPQCKQACPLKAIRQNKKGMVFIKANCDPSACSTGPVKPCQLACPFKRPPGTPPESIPRYRLNNGSTLPDGRANKCDFCYDRWGDSVLKGGIDAPTPQDGARYKGTFAKSKKCACEIVCPTGAIRTGGNAKMRRKAERRATYLQANGYPNANVYPAGYETQVIWVLLEDPAISVYGVVEA